MATETTQPRYIFIYDTYLIVEADTKDEADAKLLKVEEAVEAASGYLNIFEAWGQEDNLTGDTIREVE